MTERVESSTTEERPLWGPIGIAAGIALVILLVAVLPAEFGKDPTGLGKALGLTRLAPSENVRALSKADFQPITHTVEHELAPFESFEYKYIMHQGDGAAFGWTATDEVYFDMHAEPDGAEEGYAESFDLGNAAEGSGTYVATFPGKHGWFFENRGGAPVTVTLNVYGFVDGGFEYRDGYVRSETFGAGK